MKLIAMVKSVDGYKVNGVVMVNGQVDKTYADEVVDKDTADKLKGMAKDVANGFLGSVVKVSATTTSVTLDIPDDVANELVANYKVDSVEVTTRKSRRSLEQVKVDVEQGVANGTIVLMDNMRDKKNGGKVWKRQEPDGSWVALTKTELQFIPQ